jgi:hypothetical protein
MIKHALAHLLTVKSPVTHAHGTSVSRATWGPLLALHLVSHPGFTRYRRRLEMRIVDGFFLLPRSMKQYILLEKRLFYPQRSVQSSSRLTAVDNRALIGIAVRFKVHTRTPGYPVHARACARASSLTSARLPLASNVRALARMYHALARFLRALTSKC